MVTMNTTKNNIQTYHLCSTQQESRKWLAVWFAWIAILTALGLIGSAVAMIKSAYVSALAIVGVLFNFTLMVLLLYLIYIYMQSVRRLLFSVCVVCVFNCEIFM